MVTTNDRTVTRFSVEPVFSAVALFGIGAIANFLSRPRQSIQIGATDNSVLVIRNFDLFGPIFETSGLSRMRLPALTLLQMRSAFALRTDRRLLIPCTSRLLN